MTWCNHQLNSIANTSILMLFGILGELVGAQTSGISAESLNMRPGVSLYAEAVENIAWCKSAVMERQSIVSWVDQNIACADTIKGHLDDAKYETISLAGYYIDVSHGNNGDYTSWFQSGASSAPIYSNTASLIRTTDAPSDYFQHTPFRGGLNIGTSYAINYWDSPEYGFLALKKLLANLRYVQKGVSVESVIDIGGVSKNEASYYDYTSNKGYYNCKNPTPFATNCITAGYPINYNVDIPTNWTRYGASWKKNASATTTEGEEEWVCSGDHCYYQACGNYTTIERESKQYMSGYYEYSSPTGHINQVFGNRGVPYITHAKILTYYRFDKGAYTTDVTNRLWSAFGYGTNQWDETYIDGIEWKYGCPAGFTLRGEFTDIRIVCQYNRGLPTWVSTNYTKHSAFYIKTLDNYSFTMPSPYPRSVLCNPNLSLVHYQSDSKTMQWRGTDYWEPWTWSLNGSIEYYECLEPVDIELNGAIAICDYLVPGGFRYTY